MDFDAWWKRVGKGSAAGQEEIARLAWEAAKAQSGNYVCDDARPEVARVVTFANGRRVSAFRDGTLSVGWVLANTKAAAPPTRCDVCGASPRTHACDEEACEPRT